HARTLAGARTRDRCELGSVRTRPRGWRRSGTRDPTWSREGPASTTAPRPSHSDFAETIALARCVGCAADTRHRTRRAIAGLGGGLGRANFFDALAETPTRFVPWEGREEQSDRSPNDRAEQQAERERSNDRSIGVAADSAAHLGLSFTEQFVRALG